MIKINFFLSQIKSNSMLNSKKYRTLARFHTDSDRSIQQFRQENNQLKLLNYSMRMQGPDNLQRKVEDLTMQLDKALGESKECCTLQEQIIELQDRMAWEIQENETLAQQLHQTRETMLSLQSNKEIDSAQIESMTTEIADLGKEVAQLINFTRDHEKELQVLAPEGIDPPSEKDPTGADVNGNCVIRDEEEFLDLQRQVYELGLDLETERYTQEKIKEELTTQQEKKLSVQKLEFKELHNKLTNQESVHQEQQVELQHYSHLYQEQVQSRIGEKTEWQHERSALEAQVQQLQNEVNRLKFVQAGDFEMAPNASS